MIERLYRVLLRLYPRAFRERFGPEMLATARELDRQGVRGRRRLRAVGDAMSTAWTVRAELRAERRIAMPARGWTPVQAARRDLRAAWRSIRRAPLFAMFVVATLAVAIGANAALFGMADRLLLRGPDHIQDPDRVARLYVSARPPGMDTFTTSNVGHVTYDVVRARARALVAAATYAVNEATTGRGASAESAELGYASPELFPLLGVRPALGRFFRDPSERAGVVISYGTWQQRFGGLPDALGQPLIVNDERYVVIGVTPPGFTGPQLGRVDFWLPMDLLSARIAPDWRQSWNAQWLAVVVRLREDVTFEQASAELTSAHRAAYDGDDEAMAEATLHLAPLAADEAGAEPVEARVLRWLAAVSFAVFLIACANVMSLMLARGARRTRDVGIQLALGASRFTVVRVQLIESLVLALIAAGAGLALAWVLGVFARRSLLAHIEWTSSPVNFRITAVALAIATLGACLVGIVPALGVSRTNPVGAMRQGTRDGGGRRQRLRAALTVIQAALCVTLLIGAGLFVRSLSNARGVDLGIDADRVLVVDVRRPSLARTSEGPEREAERARRRLFYLNVLDRVRAIPGVEHASIAVGLPFGNRFSRRVSVPGREELPRVNGVGPGLSAVADDYFETIGTAILAGRPFTAADRAGSAPVAIVNEIMARVVWPGESALGRCVIVASAPCATVVGVAENTHRSQLRESPFMHVYLPHGQETGFGGAVLLVRGGDDVQAHADLVRRVVTASDASVTFVSAQTIQERIDPQLESWRLGSVVFVFSGLLALAVAAVGLYSVLAYLVADRRHEIGVRMALGARAGQVTGLVVRQGVGLALGGILAGSVLAAWAATVVEPLLFDVPARDPSVFAGAAAILLLVALAASLAPALRANRIDPVEALRAE
jgi:predicted permease